MNPLRDLERSPAVEHPSARRICVNTLSCNMGGSITVVRNLAGRLARLQPDWQFTLLYSHPDAAPQQPPPNLELRFEGRLRSVARRWAWEQLWLPFLLRRERYDLMLCVGGFTCFSTGVPQISVWQNPNILSRLPIPRSWRTEAYTRIQRAVQALSLRKTAYSIFQTWDSVEMAGDRWPMDRYPHTAIHWGMDPQRAADTVPPPLAARDPFILAVGHTYYHKNYEVLIDAIAAYRRRFGSNLALKIAGGSFHDRHHEALVRRAEQKGVGHLVQFLGALPAGQVSKLYRTASAYVTTTLLETFGLTTLEAMGSGLPVVAGRATCMPEVCGDAALYCDPRDPEDVAEKIHAIFHDRLLAQELRDRGLERVRRFTWDRTASDFNRALEHVLAERPSEATSAAAVPVPPRHGPEAEP
jgi:glycosyltransferase involved in cell wall biosynthesis